MAQEIGELFVGAYLRKVLGCPIVQYNLRERAGMLVDGSTEPTPKSQAEIDVLGLDFRGKRLYVCEVVTHLDGANYSHTKTGKDDTVVRLARKLDRHRAIVSREFSDIPNRIFMIWSPYVAAGAKVSGMQRLAAEWPAPNTLELRINDGYAAGMRELLELASADGGHTEEPFYRMCQLMTHLRGANNRRVRVRIE